MQWERDYSYNKAKVQFHKTIFEIAVVGLSWGSSRRFTTL